MAIFDEIGKKITNAGQNVVKGTKDFADVTRLNSSIADEQKRIAGFYAQLGELFYEKYGNDSGAPFREICGDIAAAFESISKYQSDIQQIKGVKACSKCGAEIQTSALFCSSCGAAIEKTLEADDAPPAKRFCVGCGAELESSAAFCSSCGQKAE